MRIKDLRETLESVALEQKAQEAEEAAEAKAKEVADAKSAAESKSAASAAFASTEKKAFAPGTTQRSKPARQVYRLVHSSSSDTVPDGLSVSARSAQRTSVLPVLCSRRSLILRCCAAHDRGGPTEAVCGPEGRRACR